jgi:hypothetical protein
MANPMMNLPTFITNSVRQHELADDAILIGEIKDG